MIKRLKDSSTLTTKHYLNTADAISVHASMIKDEIISNVRKLLNKRFMNVSSSFPIEEMLEALTIILDYNAFAFKDAFWCQLKGVTIGTTAACAVAILFFACNKVKHLIPTFAKWLIIF